MKTKALTELTDAELSAKENELSAERQRRREEAENAKAERHAFHAEAVSASLTRPIIDAFAPAHDRTSCSDKQRYSMHSDDEPRCTRCALLEIQEDGYLPDHLWVRLRLSTSE